ncbi:hypothetical protein RSAG8_12963, partial [Rhizoctonia solani AG-8 WAC10335]
MQLRQRKPGPIQSVETNSSPLPDGSGGSAFEDSSSSPSSSPPLSPSSRQGSSAQPVVLERRLNAGISSRPVPPPARPIGSRLPKAAPSQRFIMTVDLGASQLCPHPVKSLQAVEPGVGKRQRVAHGAHNTQVFGRDEDLAHKAPQICSPPPAKKIIPIAGKGKTRSSNLTHSSDSTATGLAADLSTGGRIIDSRNAGPSTQPNTPNKPPYIIPTEPVPLFPGLFTDETLKFLRLALLVKHGVLYCTLCPTKDGKNGLVNSYSKISSHLNEEHKIDTRLQAVRNAIRLVNSRYNSWHGDRNVTLVPIPEHVIAPIPFLPIYTTQNLATNNQKKQNAIVVGRCPYCKDKPYVWISSGGRNSHYNTHHKYELRLPGIPIKGAQTFYPAGSLRYFEVDPGMSVLTQQEQTPELLDKAALARNYVEHLMLKESHAPTQMRPSQGLESENHVVLSQGWASHFANEKSQHLASLVASPSTKHEWAILRDASLGLMHRYLSTITKVPMSTRESWIEAAGCERSRYIPSFSPLYRESTIKRYSLIYAAFVTFILQNWSNVNLPEESTNPPYTVALTDNIARLAANLHSLVEGGNEPDSMEIQSAIHELALECFKTVPQENKWDDLIHTFVALRSIKTDSSFRTAGELLPTTSALQYTFRAVVLQAAWELAKEDRRAAPEIYHEFVQYITTSNYSSQFGDLRLLHRQLFHEDFSKTGLRNLHWAGENRERCIFRGKSFLVAGIQKMAQAVLDRLDNILFEALLGGLTLKELGNDKDDSLDLSKIEDDIAKSDFNHSVWKDTSVPEIQNITHNLAYAMLSHPKLDHFVQGATADKKPIFSKREQLEWLKSVWDFSLLLAVCVDFYGGGPRRGQELLTMLNHNIEARLRNLFLHDGMLAFILGYSKTFALTGQDRLDFHALPPRLTKILFLFNSLVRPVAVDWMRELYDSISHPSNTSIPEDTEEFEAGIEDEGDEGDLGQPSEPQPLKPSEIQDRYVFSYEGNIIPARKLSDALRKLTLEFLGHEFGIAAWRHIFPGVCSTGHFGDGYSNGRTS